MKAWTFAWLLLGCGAWALAQPVKADESPHAHHPQTSGASTLNAQYWVADASLREGMLRVAKATAALEHLQHGHLDATQVRALAGQIKAAVDFMFANCRLDPAPDAALHPLLARLLVASQALHDNPTDAAPVTEMRAILARYQQVFRDPPGSPPGK